MGNSVSSAEDEGPLVPTREGPKDLAEREDALKQQYYHHSEFRSTAYDKQHPNNNSSSPKEQQQHSPRSRSSPGRSPRRSAPSSPRQPEERSTSNAFLNDLGAPSNLSDADDLTALTDLTLCAPNTSPKSYHGFRFSQASKAAVGYFSDDESRVFQQNNPSADMNSRLGSYSSSADDEISADRYDVNGPTTEGRSPRTRESELRGQQGEMRSQGSLLDESSSCEKESTSDRGESPILDSPARRHTKRNKGESKQQHPDDRRAAKKSAFRPSESLRRATEVALEMRMMIERKRNQAVDGSQPGATVTKNEMALKDFVIGMDPPPPREETLPTAEDASVEDARDEDTTVLSNQRSERTKSSRKTGKLGLGLVRTVDTMDMSNEESSHGKDTSLSVIATTVGESYYQSPLSIDGTLSPKDIGEDRIGHVGNMAIIQPCSGSCDPDPCGFEESVKDLLLGGEEISETGKTRVNDVKEYMQENTEIVEENQEEKKIPDEEEKMVSDPDGDYCVTKNHDQEVETLPPGSVATKSLSPRVWTRREIGDQTSPNNPEFRSVMSDDEEELDMVFVRKYDEFFDEFLWLHPDIAGMNPELLENLRAAKLKKMVELSIEAEATLEKELNDLQTPKQTSDCHRMLIEASREKAAYETALQKELHTIQQATLVMEGRLIWQAINMSYGSAKTQQTLLKGLFDNEAYSTDMLDLLPDLPDTQAIRDAVTAPPGTDISEDKEQDLRQFQVDNAFLNAEVQLLEKKVSQLESVARKHAWVDSVLLRLDPKQLIELKAEFRKKLGVVF